MISPWIISTVVLAVTTSVSLYFTFKFARIILRIEDAVEVSLDTLDAKYVAMSEILDTPLFYNSPEVRRVLNEIEDARNSVLYVANKMTLLETEEDDVAPEGE
tara:strand:- start:30 stop:338 length:309 start_codon:yes stop_codon:yes gene_type:complete